MILTESQTVKNIHVQTVDYRSPELLMVSYLEDIHGTEDNNLKGYNFGPDIWSVGLVLLYMVMRIHPFTIFIAEDVTKEQLTLKTLHSIAQILGSPSNIPDYPYLNEPGTGLQMVKDISLRKRISNMLQYSPDDRILE